MNLVGLWEVIFINMQDNFTAPFNDCVENNAKKLMMIAFGAVEVSQNLA